MEAPSTKRRKLQYLFSSLRELLSASRSRMERKRPVLLRVFSTQFKPIPIPTPTLTITSFNSLSHLLTPPPHCNNHDIKFYLHCTSSVATLEPVVPTLLVALHLYSPLSFLFTLVIVNDLLFDDKLILGLTLVFTADPAMFHENVAGSGFPVALQVKVTLLPSLIG